LSNNPDEGQRETMWKCSRNGFSSSSNAQGSLYDLLEKNETRKVS
jgi:hypothetical protein